MASYERQVNLAYHVSANVLNSDDELDAQKCNQLYSVDKKKILYRVVQRKCDRWIRNFESNYHIDCF